MASPFEKNRSGGASEQHRRLSNQPVGRQLNETVCSGGVAPAGSRVAGGHEVVIPRKDPGTDTNNRAPIRFVESPVETVGRGRGCAAGRRIEVSASRQECLSAIRYPNGIRRLGPAICKYEADILSTSGGRPAHSDRSQVAILLSCFVVIRFVSCLIFMTGRCCCSVSH